MKTRAVDVPRLPAVPEYALVLHRGHWRMRSSAFLVCAGCWPGCRSTHPICVPWVGQT